MHHVSWVETCGHAASPRRDLLGCRAPIPLTFDQISKRNGRAPRPAKHILWICCRRSATVPELPHEMWMSIVTHTTRNFKTRCCDAPASPPKAPQRSTG